MLYSPPHVRLGQYASFFAVSEPPIVHFERAKRLRSADAAVWYAVGSEAFWQQDYSAALTSWRRAMQLSPAMISLILWEASAAPDAMPLTELIPPDPATALAAANMLYPDRFTQQEMRRPILAKASTSDTQRLRLPDLYALAAIFDELGQPERAAATWEWAINRFPNDPGPRDRYARWLMADERYDEALLHLEWLRERQPDDTVLQDRLDTARHALRLKRIIEGQ
jgi:tetratricopeptide (TPR) repeat protein